MNANNQFPCHIMVNHSVNIVSVVRKIITSKTLIMSPLFCMFALLAENTGGMSRKMFGDEPKKKTRLN